MGENVKHTPGPWKRSVTNEHVVGPDGRRVATPWIGSEEWQANARLIAAAPDMLEALTEIEALCHSETRQKLLGICQRTLARVRGESGR